MAAAPDLRLGRAPFLVAILAVGFFAAAHAQNQDNSMVVATSKGSLDIKLEPIESSSLEVKYKVSFLNPGTDTLHQHQDYDFKILRDGQQLFSAAAQLNQPLIHNVDGEITVPYSFEEDGDYTIEIDILGLGFGPTLVPTDETAIFQVTAGIRSSITHNVTIVPGSSTRTTDAYSPNPVQANVGDKIIWTNKDTTLHTATSGDASGGPTGDFGGTAQEPVYIAPSRTQEFTVTEKGDIPYYCTLHPTMVGVIEVDDESPEVRVSIVSGATFLTSDAYDPNPVRIGVGGTVTWVNDDTTLHTATSGSPDDGPDGLFGGTIESPVLIAPGRSMTYTFDDEGEYDYYCTLHPTMIGTVIIGDSDAVIDARLDDDEYRVGDTVAISGEVSPDDGAGLVAIRVLNPSGAIYQVNQVPIDEEGQFQYSFGLGGTLAIAGDWRAELTYRGVERELAFTLGDLETPTSFPFVINSIHLEDSGGTEIGSARQGSPAMIMADVANRLSSTESYIVLMQVTDADNITTFISWQTGVASSHEDFQVGISWTPGTSGTYSIMAFVWDNLSSPEILSEAKDVTVQVES